MEKVKKEFPQIKILLTFFSPSGYEIRKNYEGADYVFYMPIDTKENAAKFIDIVRFTRLEMIDVAVTGTMENNVPVLRNPTQELPLWRGKRIFDRRFPSPLYSGFKKPFERMDNLRVRRHRRTKKKIGRNFYHFKGLRLGIGI